MSDNNLITAFINPLLWIDATLPFADEEPPSAESALAYLSSYSQRDMNISEIKSNYSRLLPAAYKLPIVPAEARLLMKMIFPLKNAMGCYMLGNYVESIGISGMVAEMAAIFEFEISGIGADGEPITSEEDAKIQSKKIEKMKQWQRTKKLVELKLIDDDTKIRFDCVSNQRNKYLHRLSVDDKDIEVISKHVFESTLQVLVSITGFTFSNGKVSFHQKVLNYLARQEAKEA